MKTKLLYLIGLVILCIGCEPTQTLRIEGEWEAITPHNKHNYAVVITEDMIHEYLPASTRLCKYTMSQDCLHIVRLWKSETDIDYTADCKYSFYGDTLVICDFLPTIAATYPPTYNDIKLVRQTNNINAEPESYEMGYKIIEISNSEYLDNVLANYIDIENYQVCGYGWLYCEDLFLGTSPYIHLIDNYYLLDWKWALAPDNNCVLLAAEWNDVTSRYNQKWAQEDGCIAVVTDFLDKMYWTSPRAIDTYLQITPAPPSKECWSVNHYTNPKISADYELPWFPPKTYTNTSELPDTLYIDTAFTGEVYTKEDFLAEMKRQDSLQQVYIERLKVILQTTTLSKFARAEYKF